jgi:hypothetical protein
MSSSSSFGRSIEKILQTGHDENWNVMNKCNCDGRERKTQMTAVESCHLGIHVDAIMAIDVNFKHLG